MPTVEAQPVHTPESILVVGGGVAGLVSLRNYTVQLPSQQPSSSSSTYNPRAELWERREQVGGVWFLNEKVASHEQSQTPYATQGQWPMHVPLEQVTQQQQQQQQQNASSQEQQHPVWPSPAYPQLRGNVLPRFLSFSLASPFPPVSRDFHPAEAAALADGLIKPDPFPTLAETEAYLLRFVEEQRLREKIRTGREVLAAWELPPAASAKEESQAPGWLVLARQWPSASASSSSTRSPQLLFQRFTHLSLSSGTYDTPIYTPFIPGFTDAQSLGLVHHAKWYRGPEAYRGKRVVVVGNGNSANDVAAHLAALLPSADEKRESDAGDNGRGEGKIWRSIRHKALPIFVSLPDPRIQDVAPIKRYQAVPRRIKGSHAASSSGDELVLDLELEDGTTLRDIEIVILGTGYEGAGYPFVQLLASQQPTLSPSSSTPALSSEHAARIRAHAQHLTADGAQVNQPTFLPHDHELARRFAHEPQLRGRHAELTSAVWSSVLPAGEAERSWTPMRSSALSTLPLAAASAAAETEWNPTRVPGLHQHCVLARNPSLACVGQVISYTPFVSTDLYSWYVRALWDRSLPAAAFPPDLAGRLRDETARIAHLRHLKTDVVPLEQAAFEQWRKDGCPLPAPEHLPSGLLAYHVPGTQEAAWHAHLRELIVQAKPELDAHLDDWSKEGHETIRKGQYTTKFETLLSRREVLERAQRRQEQQSQTGAGPLQTRL